jgi:hypothetical protein
MTLEFPNQSRSFEGTKNRVRFWGYDSAIEITFFMEEEALMKICPEVSSAEIALLDAFDHTVERIHQIARKIYERSHDHSYVYVLAANDF